MGAPVIINETWSQFEFPQWVESGYSIKPPACRRCANRRRAPLARHLTRYNLGSHKSLKIREAIEAKGAERSIEALAASSAFKRRVHQINDQRQNQDSG